MIKVIKQGKKPKKYKTIYIITCPDCECEFECELSDFIKIEKTLNGDRIVRCPCCEKELHTKLLDENHLKTREEEDIEIPITFPDPIVIGKNPYVTPDPYIYPKKYDPCETCPNRDGPKDAFGNPVVGDSPCQWCPNYKWRVVYTNTTSDDFKTTVKDYTVSDKITTYTVEKEEK